MTEGIEGKPPLFQGPDPVGAAIERTREELTKELGPLPNWLDEVLQSPAYRRFRAMGMYRLNHLLQLEFPKPEIDSN